MDAQERCLASLVADSPSGIAPFDEKTREDLRQLEAAGIVVGNMGWWTITSRGRAVLGRKRWNK